MKRGFTLIELLAVIVILGVIALIATPIVLNVIRDAKVSANRRSIDSYGNAVENAVANYLLKNNKTVIGLFHTTDSYKLLQDDIELDVNYNGSKVLCDVILVNKNGTVYITNCMVGDSNVYIKSKDKNKNYAYGNYTSAFDYAKEGTLIYSIKNHESIKDNVNFSDNEKYRTNSEIEVSGNNYCYSDGYTFDTNISKYKLNSNATKISMKDCINTNSCVDKYISFITDCTTATNTLYKIKSVSNKLEKDSYYKTLTTHSKSSFTFGDDYIEDKTTGTYTLTGNVFNATLDECYEKTKSCSSKYIGIKWNYSSSFDYINTQKYYSVVHLNSTSYSVSRIGSGDSSWYTLSITGMATYERYFATAELVQGKVGTEGIHKSIDNDGDTYYYQGLDANNYVEFANKLWRIVRINGDGSVRIALNGTTGEQIQYNSTYDNSKYVSYSNSNIHNYLNTWYQNNLSSYDNYIVPSNFCSDTSKISDDTQTITYGGYDRYKKNSFSFLCPPSSFNYGGQNSFKIGLLTLDELALSGMGKSFSNTSNSSIITTSGQYWLSTPGVYYKLGTPNPTVYALVNGGLDIHGVRDNYYVLPVINLNSNVKVLSGDGSKNNPYRIT